MDVLPAGLTSPVIVLINASRFVTVPGENAPVGIHDIVAGVVDYSTGRVNSPSEVGAARERRS